MFRGGLTRPRQLRKHRNRFAFAGHPRLRLIAFSYSFDMSLHFR
jgi:hypothetical protein